MMIYAVDTRHMRSYYCHHHLVAMVTIAGWQESCLTVELERTRKVSPLPALNELQVCERKKRKLLTLNQLLLFF